MDIDEARHWATLNEVCESGASAAMKTYRRLLICCARLAVAEHERAEMLEQRLDGAHVIIDGLEEKLRQQAANEEHNGCAGECKWVERGAEPDAPTETEDDPAGSVWEFIGNTSASGRRWQKVEDGGYRSIDPYLGDLGSYLDISYDPPNDPKFRRVGPTETWPEEKPRPHPLVERKNVDMVSRSRDRQGEIERLQIALFLEEWIGGEAGAALAALVRGCFHWKR